MIQITVVNAATPNEVPMTLRVEDACPLTNKLLKLSNVKFPSLFVKA